MIGIKKFDTVLEKNLWHSINRNCTKTLGAVQFSTSNYSAVRQSIFTI